MQGGRGGAFGSVQGKIASDLNGPIVQTCGNARRGWDEREDKR
jgi:hypothetical protein